MTGKRQRGPYDTYVTYYHWLIKEYLDWGGPITDLARDAYDDPTFPKKAKKFEVLWEYLGHTDAAETFLDSWKIYVLEREEMYFEELYEGEE